MSLAIARYIRITRYSIVLLTHTLFRIYKVSACYYTADTKPKKNGLRPPAKYSMFAFMSLAAPVGNSGLKMRSDAPSQHAQYVPFAVLFHYATVFRVRMQLPPPDLLLSLQSNLTQKSNCICLRAPKGRVLPCVFCIHNSKCVYKTSMNCVVFSALPPGG